MKDGGNNHKVLLKELNDMRKKNKDLEKKIESYRQNEIKLHENEERLKVLFEYAPDAYYLNDMKGKFIDGNKAAEELIGYNRDELLGKSFLNLKLLSKSQLPKAVKVLAKNKLGYPTGPDEFVLNRKDGRKKVVDIRTYPIELNGQKVVLGIARDVTKRKKLEGVFRRHRANLEDLMDDRTEELKGEIVERINAQDALKESEEKFRLLFEEASEGIIYLDPEGTIIDANPRLFEMMGTSREDIIGQNALIAMKDYEMDYDMIISAFEEAKMGRVPKNTEIKMNNLHGEEIVFKAHPSIIKKDDEIIGLSVLLEDITVKKQIEESLKESEGELRSIFNGVSDGIALLDSDGKIVKINKQLEDISNYSEEDILCKQIHELEIFSEKNIGQMLENFEAILSGEDVPPLELDATMKSGDRIYLEIQPTLIKTGDSVAGVVACIRDITMRKEFERALLESEDYLRTIFNSIEIGVAYLDKDGRVIKINQHLMDFSGYTEKDILDKQVNFLDMFTPDSLENMIIELEKLMSGEQVPPLEVEVFIKNGEKKQVVIQTNIVKKDDEVIGLIATLKDVSEQKHAEKAQKESEELYRLVSENTSDLIAICDLDGVYHYANPSHIQLGYKPEELIGISGMDLVHPEDLSEMLRLLEEALVDKIKSKDSRTIEFRTKGKDRDWHSLESTVNLIKDNDGNYTKLIFVSRDITERKKAREKILEERNRASLYLDILGHDVSNLNQTLISSCELMLSQEGLPEVHKKYAEMIFKQCIELVRLVDNVNRLSAMKEGEFEIRDVNLYKLLTNSFERIYQAYPERNISISHTLPESGLSVRSNYLLSDVFDNIIGNAVKYNNNDDINININHSHFDGGKYLKLEFKDNGPGIPDELKDQVFKRLERGEESVHGSGLGLTIAHEVVSRYGGQIWVEDRVKGKYKEGANFVMLLPKADANN